MTCRVPVGSRTTCHPNLLGGDTCRTTTDHPGVATTTCRPTLFGDRCTTRISPPVRETTTCRSNHFGDTTCRTPYSRSYSYSGPSYTTYYSSFYDPYWSSTPYCTPSYQHSYSVRYDHEDDGIIGSIMLGILGISCLAAAFVR